MTEFKGTFELVESKDMDKFARVALASKYNYIPYIRILLTGIQYSIKIK